MGSTDTSPDPGSTAPKWAGAGALRHPVMRVILLSESISALGAQMTFIALPWFVLSTTGSATRMGLVFAAELLPVALLGIPSGLAVQRFGVRRTMYGCDLIRTPLVAAIPLLHSLDVLTFPLLLALVFSVGTFTAPYLSAQRLLIPEVFGDDDAMVVQGNGLLEGVIRLATLVGPAVAGVLISVIGAVNVLYLDAATYVGSFLILYAALPKATVSPVSAAAPGESRGLLAGARYVLSHPVLRRVAAASVLFGFFFPPLLASLPVLADQRYAGDPRVAGFLFAAWGAGALIGTFGVMRFATRMPPLRMGALAGVGVAAPLWLLVLPLDAWQFGLVLVASGLFTPMLNAPLITLITLRTPTAVRAHVMTFVMTANLLAGPVAYSLAGPALDALGLRPLLLVVAAGVSLAALLLLTFAGLRVREEDRSRAAVAPADRAEPVESGAGHATDD